MSNLVDSSLWIDYFRRKTPLSVKRQIDQLINSPDLATCEPILFELLRATSKTESARVEEFFTTIPVLHTPRTLWRNARILGQKCFAAGLLPRSMDLLIAEISLHHETTLTTFDDHFEQIARVCPLRLNLLTRLVP